MLRRSSVLLIVLLLLGATRISAVAKEPPRGMLGLRLGMSEEAVHKRLKKVAAQQKEEKEGEEEGEQEVWLIKNDPRFDFIIVRFNRQHKLWHMTLKVRQGSQMRYGDLADTKDAKQASDGRNYSYTWKGAAKGRQADYMVVARGADPELLTSFSIYSMPQK